MHRVASPAQSLFKADRGSVGPQVQVYVRSMRFGFSLLPETGLQRARTGSVRWRRQVAESGFREHEQERPREAGVLVSTSGADVLKGVVSWASGNSTSGVDCHVYSKATSDTAGITKKPSALSLLPGSHQIPSS